VAARNRCHFTEFPRHIAQNALHQVAVEVKFAGDCDASRKNESVELSVVVSNSMRRRSKGRSQWRFIVGLSVLGLLIIASASHASQPFMQ
jgi:hypothetical protein